MSATVRSTAPSGSISSPTYRAVWNENERGRSDDEVDVVVVVVVVVVVDRCRNIHKRYKPTSIKQQPVDESPL
jgi:hypothetical protein